MNKFSLALLAISLQLISGAIPRINNYRLSDQQITRLRDLATEWKEVINSEKNPCDEFNEFMCSNKKFLKRTAKAAAEQQLTDIFFENPELQTTTEAKYLEYSRDYGFHQEVRNRFMKSFKFDNSIGNWPAFDENWDDSKFNLSLAIAELDSYDSPVVFIHSVESDPVENYILIKKQELLEINGAKVLLENVFQMLEIKHPEEILADVALFEKTFKEADEFVTSDANKTMTFSELKDFIPEIDWDRQIHVVFGVYPSENYPVKVMSHEKLKKIYSSISKLSPRVIANYFFCVLSFNTINIRSKEARKLFMPVAKQAFMKHIFDQNKIEILKGIYTTIAETLQEKNIIDVFGDHDNSSMQIAKFINEGIFELSDEDELAQEFKEISNIEDGDDVNNYYRLQQLYRRRLARPLFAKRNTLGSEVLKTEIINNLILEVPDYIEEPSSIIFESINDRLLFDIINRAPEDSVFSKTRRECLSKQTHPEKIIDDDMKATLAIQLILKLFSEWTKNYPEVVQEENKILQEYDLSAEKLLVMSIGKYLCNNVTYRKIFTTALANTVEFPRIYNCPAGSKFNAVEKCI